MDEEGKKGMTLGMVIEMNDIVLPEQNGNS
jgi:hypothetical protein